MTTGKQVFSTISKNGQLELSIVDIDHTGADLVFYLTLGAGIVRCSFWRDARSSGCFDEWLGRRN